MRVARTPTQVADIAIEILGTRDVPSGRRPGGGSAGYQRPQVSPQRYFSVRSSGIRLIIRYLPTVQLVSSDTVSTGTPPLATLGNSGDVSSTLGELERKLRELEQELARVGHPSPAANEPLVPPPPTPITPAPPAPAAAPSIAAVPPLAPGQDGDDRLTALEEQLDALRRYGEAAELGRSLLEAYRSALHEMERPLPAARRAAGPAPVSTPHAPTPPPGAARPRRCRPWPRPASAVRRPRPRRRRPRRPLPPTRPPSPASASRPGAAHPRCGAGPAIREVLPGHPAPAPGPDWDPIAPASAAPRWARPRGPGRDHDPPAAAQAAGLQAAREAEAATPSDMPMHTHPVAPASPASRPPEYGPGRVPAPDLSDVGGTVVPAPPATLVPSVHDAATHQSYIGPVTIDAGPFTDIASLSAFEQAIARIPGVRDVYVRGFQGQRVVIDVEVGVPTVLVTELAALSPEPFIVNGADATGLVVTITPVSPDA